MIRSRTLNSHILNSQGINSDATNLPATHLHATSLHAILLSIFSPAILSPSIFLRIIFSKTLHTFMLKQTYTLIVILSLFSPFYSYSRIIIPKNQTEKTLSLTSLDFPVQAIATNKNNLYIGASIPGAQNHTISALAGHQNAIYGITPEKIKLNGVADQPNPLFNASIEHLSLIKKEGTFSSTEHLVAVTKENPDTVYIFENLNHDLRSISDVPDADGAVTSKIVNLTTGNHGTVFMATKPHAAFSQFGETGSGIAIATFQQGAPTTNFSLADMGEGMPNRIVLDKIIQDTETLNKPELDKTETLNQIIGGRKKRNKKRPKPVRKKTFFPRAVPINTSLSPLKIGNSDLAAIVGDTAVLHWDKTLQRLFVGLNIITGATGGRSLIVGHFKNGKLILEPIAPETLFDATNTHIIGTTNSYTALSIHQLASMSTSTQLHYLIVRGGNGHRNETTNTMYALPLVNNQQAPIKSVSQSPTLSITDSMTEPVTESPQKSIIGTIAAKNAPITYLKSYNNLQQQHPATNPEQMTLSTDPAAAIGGGPLDSTWGTIINMLINKDCVYAIIHNTTGDAGIFQSQALFDHTGAIKRWTQWHRYAGVYNDLLQIIIDTNTGVVTAVTDIKTDDTITPDDSNATNITRTEWSHGDDSLSAALLADLGPISTIKDFCPLTPGLSSISVIATAYNDQLTLAQTGTMDGNGLIAPTTGNVIAHKQFKNAALSHISPITDVALAYSKDRNQGFICCGGSKGVAILTDNGGNGYSKISHGLREIDNTLTFKVLGNYTLVKRVIADGNYLYILTDTTLDRIELTHENSYAKTSASPYPTIRPIAVRLADTQQSTFKSNSLFFNDILISGKLGLLATSNGLFRVGDGMDITTACDPKSLNWTLVDTPDNTSNQITHLYAISSTGRMQDYAQKNTNGQIYVLSADRGNNRGKIYRFSVESVTDTDITSTTVQPFLSDFFYVTKALMPIPSFWINLKEFCDIFATDGTLSFLARAQENKIASYLKTVYSSLPITMNISKGSDIPSMTRNSAAGVWLIGNEKGIYTLE